MIRDVLGWLDFSRCAEISLALFVLVFVAVTIQALAMSRQSSDRFAAVPLDDGVREEGE